MNNNDKIFLVGGLAAIALGSLFVYEKFIKQQPAAPTPTQETANTVQTLSNQNASLLSNLLSQASPQVQTDTIKSLVAAQNQSLNDAIASQTAAQASETNWNGATSLVSSAAVPIAEAGVLAYGGVKVVQMLYNGVSNWVESGGVNGLISNANSLAGDGLNVVEDTVS